MATWQSMVYKDVDLALATIPKHVMESTRFKVLLPYKEWVEFRETDVYSESYANYTQTATFLIYHRSVEIEVTHSHDVHRPTLEVSTRKEIDL